MSVDVTHGGGPALPAGQAGATEAPPLTLPPWMLAGTEREAMGESFARAKWLLLAYWLLTASGFVVLMGAVLTESHGNANTVPVFVGLVLTSTLGILFGNVLGMLRLRGWVLHVSVWLATIAACMSAAVAGAFAVVFAITFLWSVTCGHLTLQRKFSLWALWIPVVCWTGGMLTIIERSGGLRRWQTGAKETIWHPFALGLLFAMVVMFFLFLAGQDRYHQLVWQAGANTAAPTQLTRHSGRGGVKLTGKGALTLVVLALVVSGLTALMAPYLWRVGPQRGDGNRQGDGQGQPRDGRQREPGDEPGRPRFDGQSLRRAMERAARRAREQGKDLLPFIPLFLLNRPLRRWWLLRRLRKPLIYTPPSQRAANLWRYVVIALGDTDSAPRGGETLDQVATRVNTARAARHHPPVQGLSETAEVYERIRYGLGIPEGSLEALQSRAEHAFDDLRRPMTAWERFKSWWRRID